MLPSYEAIYEHGQLHWLAEPPPQNNVKVIVTIIEPVKQETPDSPNGQKLALLFEKMAETGIGKAFGDPLEWQRTERQDRPLPGRGDCDSSR
jgi:hypothetical protein